MHHPLWLYHRIWWWHTLGRSIFSLFSKKWEKAIAAGCLSKYRLIEQSQQLYILLTISPSYYTGSESSEWLFSSRPFSPLKIFCSTYATFRQREKERRKTLFLWVFNVTKMMKTARRENRGDDRKIASAGEERGEMIGVRGYDEVCGCCCSRPSVPPRFPPRPNAQMADKVVWESANCLFTVTNACTCACASDSFPCSSPYGGRKVM